MQLYPFDFARDLYRMFSKDKQAGEKNKSTQQTASQQVQTNKVETPPMPQNHAPAMEASQMQMQNNMGMPYMQGMQGMMGMQGMPNYQGGSYMMPPVQDINIQPAQFQSFTVNQPMTPQPENINLIMDVPLEVTVELGRTSKSIKEILDFTPGTIIELNKLAGEPIDVLVNGKYVAKGEVVVIEDSFGIRVTEIIK
jgi:flagellar motor switch protein FliN/FliY